ncbi:hypothetical protein QFC22_005822 [Naganishia vaughanmartiniae]|uniref:Uncharacterized protein n=1 Tax=Naganishia vaughanmartiniae TaxID=1424756 RepID=A0ACC2WS45_9TREE|nr:hypothetical protein QFC22_005822 [Naganishia vaughanmartiniae]
MATHPLSTALSSLIPVTPSFIYLHYPFHSSGYALPAELTTRQHLSGQLDGKESRDGVMEEDEVGRVIVTVDIGALAPVGVSLSQKTFYNAVIRQVFSSITTKLSFLLAQHQPHSHNGTAPPVLGAQPSPNKFRRNGSAGATTTTSDHFHTAVTAFQEKFTQLSQKQVYRFDTFLLRLRGMMHAFRSALSILPRGYLEGDTVSEMGTAAAERGSVRLVLVLLEGQLMQRCLGGTWHAVLRLNEMIESFETTLVLCSTHAWDDVRPMTGDAQEPYHLFLRAPTKNETLSALAGHNIHPLFPYFLDLLFTASCHLIPYDLIPESEKLAKVLWQIYMLPLVGFPHREARSIYLWEGQRLADADTALPGDALVDDSGTEPLRITYQLLTDLKNQSAYAFSAANESLIPGRISSARFLEVFTGERRRQRRELEEEFRDATRDGGEREREGGAWFALASQVRQQQPHQPVNGTTDPIIAKLSALPTTKPSIPKPPIPSLPLYAKYLILAAYCASYNSPRSDLRMFGRGPLTLRGKTRRSGLDGAGSTGRGYEGSGSAGKKVGAGLKKQKTLGKAGKVPQALLGPKSFPLERMLAVFQSLLAEHGFRQDAYHSDEFSDSESDSDEGSEVEEQGVGADAMEIDNETPVPDSPSRRKSSKRNPSSINRSGGGVLDFSVVDEKAERIERKRRRENEMLRSWEEEVEEISRSIGLFALIRELEGLRLLNRVSPKDRLDNILLRCEAPKEMVLEFARQVKVDLTSYLVEGE